MSSECEYGDEGTLIEGGEGRGESSSGNYLFYALISCGRRKMKPQKKRKRRFLLKNV